MKSYLKVIPFYLSVKQFCRAGNGLNIQRNIKHQVFPTPPTSTLGFQKVDINKINLHTGKLGTGKKKWMQPRFQINLFKFLLQKDTSFCSQTQNKMQQAKIHKVTTNILSFTFLQPAHGSNINFAWLQVHPTV